MARDMVGYSYVVEFVLLLHLFINDIYKFASKLNAFYHEITMA